jgi:hypothetical protein
MPQRVHAADVLAKWVIERQVFVNEQINKIAELLF